MKADLYLNIRCYMKEFHVALGEAAKASPLSFLKPTVSEAVGVSGGWGWVGWRSWDAAVRRVVMGVLGC